MGRKDPNYGKYFDRGIHVAEDGTTTNTQYHNFGYGFWELQVVGTREGILERYHREQRAYPINGYGGSYREPQDLGDGLFIGFASHSNSCD